VPPTGRRRRHGCRPGADFGGEHDRNFRRSRSAPGGFRELQEAQPRRTQPSAPLAS
jgi:hypothetical protein